MIRRMRPYYKADGITLYFCDCRDVLPTISGIHSCVTDPPYGLKFMGKSWDYDVPPVDTWKLILGALLPGAFLLSFAGTRTQHRMAVNIEDAGFEIRDMIAWVYGSGFPKSLDVSKALDKMAGAEREVVGTRIADDIRGGALNHRCCTGDSKTHAINITTPATNAAKQWEGFGTALKPALEPCTLARKPLIGTVAQNVLAHGCGCLNIDGCRVDYASDDDKGRALAGDAFKRKDTSDKGWSRPWMADLDRVARMNAEAKQRAQAGRFPANLLHDGSAEVVSLFPVTTSRSILPHHKTHESENRAMSGKNYVRGPQFSPGSSGSAARFFYCSKASRKDRGEGNTHPTVKPTDLMRYLCRLVTPPGGIVIDPFMGSGSTAVAAIREGLQFVGVERDRNSLDIAVDRIKKENNK
jgi:DNA modification methylase